LKERRKNQDGLNIHLTPVEITTWRNVEKENRTRFNNAWSIAQLRLLVNDSTTILGQGLGPILWGIKDLA
jgi:hypothetical protein